MVELIFVKNGKDYKVYAGDKEIGKMYKDNKRSHLYAIVCQFNFIVPGYTDYASGKTYKQVKKDAQELYERLMYFSEKNNLGTKPNPKYNKPEWK